MEGKKQFHEVVPLSSIQSHAVTIVPTHSYHVLLHSFMSAHKRTDNDFLKHSLCIISLDTWYISAKWKLNPHEMKPWKCGFLPTNATTVSFVSRCLFFICVGLAGQLIPPTIQIPLSPVQRSWKLPSQQAAAQPNSGFVFWQSVCPSEFLVWFSAWAAVQIYMDI